MTNANDYLSEKYLDYVNNYLTVDLFAEHNGLRYAEAVKLLELGKLVHERNVANYKKVVIGNTGTRRAAFPTRLNRGEAV